MSIDSIFRLIGMVIFGLVGWMVTVVIGRTETSWLLAVGLGGAAFGLLATPYLTTHPFRQIQRWIIHTPIQAFFAAAIGLVFALVAAALLALPLSMLPGPYGRILPLVVAVISGFLGVLIALARVADFSRLLGLPSSDLAKRAGRTMRYNGHVIVDTSAIIDGRIADVSRTGFIDGPLLIPRFVLNELQHIADSSDPMRRKRGRRGLEMLSKLQKESNVPVEILDVDFENLDNVDQKLVKLAVSLQHPVITNDFNLNRVAELQGVKVLNVNELAAAIKPVVLPGEEMEIYLAQDGKELGQGVGFLDDGTMVVVEDGRRFVNSRVEVVVTRVLQTAVGRMIFAQLKSGASSGKGERE